ncbi:hypothetical protein UT300006_41130 [Clostridium sp. CTA-6]
MMKPLANIIKKIENSVIFNSLFYFILLFLVLIIGIVFTGEYTYVYSQF